MTKNRAKPTLKGVEAEIKGKNQPKIGQKQVNLCQIGQKRSFSVKQRAPMSNRSTVLCQIRFSLTGRGLIFSQLHPYTRIVEVHVRRFNSLCGYDRRGGISPVFEDGIT